MVGDVVTLQRKSVDRHANPAVAQAAREEPRPLLAPSPRVIALVRRNREWLQETYSFWLRTAHETVNDDHRSFCLYRASRYESLLGSCEQLLRNLEGQVR